jgi:hypothetical protein
MQIKEFLTRISHETKAALLCLTETMIYSSIRKRGTSTKTVIDGCSTVSLTPATHLA